jgi:tellurite resistance protein TerC
MRAIFIALGAALISAFSLMFLIFGLLLIFTAVQLFRHRAEDPDIDDNAIVRLTRRVLPVTESYDDGRMITRVASLAVIAVVLVITVTASLWKARREPETRAHAGSLRETRGDADDG